MFKPIHDQRVLHARLGRHIARRGSLIAVFREFHCRRFNDAITGIDAALLAPALMHHLLRL